jgi:hypothetical protein
MENTMELVHSNGPMEVSTRASGRIAERTARESSRVSMVPSMKVSGLMASTTERESWLLQMAKCTLVFSRMGST